MSIFNLALPKDERPRQVKILILEKLPLDNYHLLKYLIQFLSKVSKYNIFFLSCWYLKKIICPGCSLTHCFVHNTFFFL